MDKTQNMTDLYHKGATLRDIAFQYKITWQSVRKRLIKAGVRMRPKGYKKYSYDHNAFLLDTPTSLYVIGLLMADGNISQNTIQIELAEKDECLLKEIQQFLQYSGPITSRTRKNPGGVVKSKKEFFTTVSLRVTAPDLVKRLAQWGVLPNKSKTAQVNTDILFRSGLEEFFFRGLFDGDGCVSNKGKNGSHYANLCGSPAMVKTFRAWCEKRIHKKGYLLVRSPHFHVAQFYGTTANELIHLLYGSIEGPRLPRKANLFSAISEL